jgi:transcriptional regulator with XRE-family HTH domain
MIYSKIKTLITDRNITVPQLADKIGMTKGGLYAAIEKNTLSVKTLEKIAEVFDVPITSFFEDENDEWTKPALIAEVKKNEKTISELHDNCVQLLDMLRAKRSSLRLILMNIRSTQDLIKQNITNTEDEFIIDLINKIANSLKGIDLAINDSEHFDNEDSEYYKKVNELFFNHLKVPSEKESNLTLKATEGMATKKSKD